MQIRAANTRLNDATGEQPLRWRSQTMAYCGNRLALPCANGLSEQEYLVVATARYAAIDVSCAR